VCVFYRVRDDEINSTADCCALPELSSTITATSPENNQPAQNSTANSLIGPELSSTTPAASPSIITPEMIRPFLKAKQRKVTNQTSRKGETQILTDTPVKAKFEARQQARDLKKSKTRKRKGKGLFINNDLEKPKKKRKKNKSTKPTTIADDDDTPCGVCGKRANEPPLEDWKQCLDCQQWFHERCCPEDTDICYTCLG